MTIQEIQAQQTVLLDDARVAINQITNDTPEARAKELEAEHDQLIRKYNRLEVERLAQLRENEDNEPDPRRPLGDLRGASADNKTAFALLPEQRMSDQHRGSSSEYRELSIGGLLRAMALGPKTDAEKRALAEGSDSAGGYTVPDSLSSQMIDRARSASVVVRAGARTIPLKSDVNQVAKVLTDPTPAWRLENAIVAESGATFGQVVLKPKSMVVLVKASRELLEDSLNIEDALRNMLAQSLALELDRAAMFGTGVDPEPRGIVNFAGVQTVALGGELVDYSALLTARGLIRQQNHPGPSAYIMSVRDETAISKFVDSTNQPLQIPPSINGVPQLATTAVPTNGGVGTNESTIIAGDFSKLLIGIRSQLRIEVVKERFVDNFQYGFVAHLRADFAAEYENAFVKITGVQPAP